MGALEAAEELRSPIILQLAEVQFPEAPMEMMAPLYLEAARRSSVPVCVHLDHGQSLETCVRAIRLGFTSVMFDGAALPFDENVAASREVTRIAKAAGVDVEAELGKVGNSGVDTADVFTDVDEAVRFVGSTGIDALAVAIGNLHGHYVHTPQLNIQRLIEIHEACDRLPLVLHGGSGKNRYAYLISDCQTSVADFANFPNDSSVTAICVPLESKGLNNVFIDSVSLNAPAFSVGSSVAVEVMVRNEGDESLEKVPLTLYVDDKQRALATVDLPALGTVSTTMHFTLEHGGIVDGRVETTDYPVTFDDKYYFSLNVRDRIRLLVVEGREPNEYLQRLFVGDSVVRYQSLQLQQMDFSRVAENDVVILDELPALTSGMAQTLHSFVEEGGSVVVVAGSKADEGSYNEALRLFAAPRLSGWNGGRVAGGVVNVEHPLYQGVFAGRNDITELPTVTGYHRLAADGTTHRERIITLANGDDYITATSCGSGRLYLIASPLRDANSDFVRQALFVPTLYNMALLSIHPTAPALSLDASAPVPLAGRYGGDGGSVKLRGKDNDYEEIPDVRRMGSGSSLVPHGSIREAGNYHLVVDGEATEGLSFNYSRRESLMQYLSPSAVAQLIKDYHLDHCSVVAQAEKPLDGYLKSQMEGRQLWRWCIVLALLMLLAEIALIRWPERWKTKKNKK